MKISPTDGQIVRTISGLVVLYTFKKSLEFATQNQAKAAATIREDMGQIVKRIDFSWQQEFLTPN